VRNIIWALLALVGMVGFAAPPAYAGATCKIVPSWCPPPPGGGGTTSVPEPATLGVLAMGACAAALAAAKRRGKK
jgi:hypothetical protein